MLKGFFLYECIDDWENFNETSLREEEFYSNLNMEDITDADYMHGKRICKDLEIKNFILYLEEKYVTQFINMQNLITNI